MTLTIHKGHHWPRWWWLRWPFYYTYVIEREFLFDFSCVYNLQSDDQQDHNKLFGIGFTPDDHKESARIGWRYDPARRVFILSAYCYVDGQRIMKDLCDAAANRKYIGRIVMQNGYYRFIIFQKEGMVLLGMDSINKNHNKKFGYKLGIYFGGNQTAPHTIKIEIKKV